jgi:hypothetical protein
MKAQMERYGGRNVSVRTGLSDEERKKMTDPRSDVVVGQCI